MPHSLFVHGKAFITATYKIQSQLSLRKDNHSFDILEKIYFLKSHFY